jgi:hypothetical protein
LTNATIDYCFGPSPDIGSPASRFLNPHRENWFKELMIDLMAQLLVIAAVLTGSSAAPVGFFEPN